MKFTINNNLRLLTCPLLLAGAVCCSSGNDGDTPAPGPGPDPSPVTGDVLAYVTSADGNRLFTIMTGSVPRSDIRPVKYVKSGGQNADR